MIAATQKMNVLKLATSYPEKRTRSASSRRASKSCPSLLVTMKRPASTQRIRLAQVMK